MANKNTELVEIVRKQAVTTSLKVAEIFGKEHKNVIRDIDKIVSDMAEVAAEQETPKLGNGVSTPLFRKSTYQAENGGRKYPIYYMNFDGFTLLAMGFTGKEALKFKLAYRQTKIKLSNFAKIAMINERFSEPAALNA